MSSYREDAADDRSLLLVAANDEVIAYRRTDGVVAWRQSMPTVKVFGVVASDIGPLEIAIVNGRVYVGLRDRIVCLDYKSGAVIGQVPLPEAVRRPCFLIDGEHMYIVATETMICMSLDGRLVWQSPHGLSLMDGPALALPGNIRLGDADHSR
jgi:outer membrane protein assembly factor BamB